MSRRTNHPLLAGSLTAVALGAGALALSACGGSSAPTAATPATPPDAAARAVAVTTQDVKLVAKSDVEHGKMGPDGKWHDAFLPASFTVKAGAKVTVTVVNYDTGAHSFDSAGLHVNQLIAAAKGTTPRTTTFTFTAPTKAGKYPWWCAEPCDPWAMAHVGYMRGYVTVRA